MIAALASAALLGLLTALSPCPLATNIAAISYVGRHAATPRRSIRAGLAYVAGRTLCYTVLAGLLTAGVLAAATTSSTLSRVLGLFVGPALLVAGGVLLGWIPAPSLGGAGGKLSEKLAGRGDTLGAFLMGGLFALSFCPSSAALYFGSLIPLAAGAGSTVLVPATYGAATGLPVLAIAALVAAGGHGLGRAFDRAKALELWLRRTTGVALVGVGLYLCARPMLGA